MRSIIAKVVNLSFNKATIRRMSDKKTVAETSRQWQKSAGERGKLAPSLMGT
jgi:hypothetical protein